ncbi:MAG: GSCFA domain-containing protein [Bacteroidaceae bacterium]|nr:GSCFA domain-containing protein [Bacteroidaceae bacterium]
MNFRTIVDIPASDWKIEPLERMMFVGSCFADNMGKRFDAELFRTVVNPHGVMYNPASVLHSVERCLEGFCPSVAVLTYGTNHVYRLKSTGEIVDNCRKQPQSLFQEEELSVEACADYMMRTVELLRRSNPDVHVVLTVSPIRYSKYGYHGSQLSKSTLLLAVDRVVNSTGVSYFPSYEVVNDELRDYRFYSPDMLHPSEQAVDYIFERFADVYFSSRTKVFLSEWHPIRQALNHRPFNPDAAEYKQFLERALEQKAALLAKYE